LTDHDFDTQDDLQRWLEDVWKELYGDKEANIRRDLTRARWHTISQSMASICLDGLTLADSKQSQVPRKAWTDTRNNRTALAVHGSKRASLSGNPCRRSPTIIVSSTRRCNWRNESLRLSLKRHISEKEDSSYVVGGVTGVVNGVANVVGIPQRL
jgi:hypothetical protein